MDKYINMENLPKKRKYGFSIQDEYFNAGWNACLNNIKSIPAADVAPVIHGKWHNIYMTSPSSFAATCSICGISNDIPHPISAHYCPNCGAKMDKDGNEK